MTEGEGDPVWLSVTQPRSTPVLCACLPPYLPSTAVRAAAWLGAGGFNTICIQQRTRLFPGQMDSPEHTGHLGSKEYACACQNPLQKSFLLNFGRIGQLRAGFGQDTFRVKQLRLVGTLSNKLKGQKAVREFLQIMSDEQGLERETVQRTPPPPRAR